MGLVHQIWHGDSAELGKRFQAKRQIRSVITDPPFGVNNQSNSAVTPDGRAMARKIANDETPEIAMATFERVMRTIIPGMMDESDVYVFTSYQVLEEWLRFTRQFFEPFGFERKALLTWEKDGPGQGDLNSWGMGVEFAIYFKRGSRVPTAKRRNAVLHYSQIRPDKLIHPHEKPIDLLRGLIEYSAAPGEFVVDPFGGSGSLVRAAKACGRSAVAIEYDKLNYDMALKALNEREEDLFA